MTSVTVNSKAPEFSDLGNAQRLVALHGKELHYCFLWKSWLVWSGKHWQVDHTGEIERRAKSVVDELLAVVRALSQQLEEAIKRGGKNEIKELQKELEKAVSWTLTTQSESRLRAMVILARSERTIPVLPGELDKNPWLLNTLSGVVDLRTGEQRPSIPEDLITKLAPVAYDPSASCPQWLAFLDRIFAGKPDLIDFVQRALGYALTGDTSEQSIFIFCGRGANGKSTLQEMISFVLGDYVQQTDFSSFLVQRGDRVRNDLAKLQGARCVFANEVGEGRRLDEVVIKQLTGQDTISARFLYGEFFEFQPTFKIFLAANHKPLIRGTDHAIWRRIKLIPFDVTIPPAEQDKKLKEKLLMEAPGILAWVVQGYLKWQKEGLHAPSIVQAATEAYRTEMDVVGQFLSECCMLNASERVNASTLYSVFTSWCERMGEYVLSHKAFSLRLSERGFERVKSGGKMVWRGVGVQGISSPAVGRGEDREDVEGSAQSPLIEGEIPLQ